MARAKKQPHTPKQYWVGYCRKSTDDPKKQQITLEDQDDAAKQHYQSLPEAEKKGRPLLILPHEKVSAFHPNKRRIFKTLLEMADRGEVYGVIAAQSNRLSRNREESGAFEQRLVDGRITYFDAVMDNRRYTGENSNDIFMLGVEGNMSWKDSKDKGIRIKTAMLKRAKEGKHMGRKPFGFKPNPILKPDGSILRGTAIDGERLPHAIEIYRMMATESFSLDDLVEWTEKNQIRSRPAENNPTGKLSRTAIAHILHDPYYKGEQWFDKQFQERWTDDPPVPEPLWNRVQLVMLKRCCNTARVKKDSLRKLFLYGSAIKCGKCKANLSPYKVTKKSGKTYIYYECKNQKTKCKVSIKQPLLDEQYKEAIKNIQLGQGEVQRLRDLLLTLHQEKAQDRGNARDRLNEEYKQIEKKISDQLDTLKMAQEMGVADVAEAKIDALTERRREIKTQLDQNHEEGTAWIERAVRGFELLKMTDELLTHGSPHVREATLKAIASNYYVRDGKLVCDLRSPFKEASVRDECPEWWAVLDSNQ